jgi:hypothetical protein
MAIRKANRPLGKSFWYHGIHDFLKKPPGDASRRKESFTAQNITILTMKLLM